MQIDDTVRWIGPSDTSLSWMTKYRYLDPSVRIDAFCLICVGSQLVIGRNSHIGAGCKIFGGSGRVIISDYSGFSPGVTAFTACDNFTDGSILGPGYDDDLRNVKTGDIILKQFSGVGANSIVFPGVTIGKFARVGAGSMVTRDVPDGEYWDSRNGRFQCRFKINEERMAWTIREVESRYGEAREWA